MKRILAVALSLLLLVGLMPTAALADEGNVTIAVIVDPAVVKHIAVGSLRFTSNGVTEVAAGTSVKISYSRASGVSSDDIDGIYINDVLIAATGTSCTYTFTDDATVEVRLKKSDEWTPLAYDNDAVTNVQTRGAYPWTNTNGTLASGNQNTTAASVLAVTAVRTGTLQFQYKVNTAAGKGWLLYKKGAELTRSNYGSADNNTSKTEYAGETEWSYAQINVNAGDVVYFLHYKDNGNFASETVWLRNFGYASADGYAVSAEASGPGAVSVSKESAAAGEEATFTATPNGGNTFYGWVQDGHFVSGEQEYTTRIHEDTALTAIFGTTSAYEARIDGVFYPTLSAAVTAGGTVVLTANANVTADLTIGSGTTLVIPYSKADASVDMGTGAELSTRLYANSIMNGFTGNITPQGSDVTYTLTVDSRKKLNVTEGGMLVLGGQFSGSSTSITGQTYGAHSEIKLENDAELNIDGGIFSCSGYVYGAGNLNITDGGTMYENYVVTDFHGGTNMFSALGNGVFPFGSYVVMNTQVETTLDPSASVYGYCAAPVGGTQFYHTSVKVVGSDALIQLSDGTATMSYDSARNYNGIGTTNIKVNGDAKVSSMNITLMGSTFDTSTMECPIPYSVLIEQESGTITLDTKIKVMPGGAILVDQDADLIVSEHGSLRVEDNEVSHEFGSTYPTASQLTAKGYHDTGAVGVSGNMTVQSGGTIQGLLYVSPGGTVKLEEDANVVEDTTLLALNNPEDLLELNTELQTGAEKRPSAGNQYQLNGTQWTERSALLAELTLADNFDIRSESITVSEIAGGSFKVTCANACAVGIANADGSYTRLTYISGSGNSYVFSVGDDYDQNIKIVVAIKGDVNGDGAVSLDDALLAQRSTYGSRSKNRY